MHHPFRPLCCVVTATALCACSAPPPPPPRPPAVSVRSELVQPATFRGELPMLGVVRPATTVPLVAPVGGPLRFAPRFAAGLREGARVSAGEPIGTIDSERARLGLAEARLEADSARAELERIERAVEAGILPASDRTTAELRARLAGERLASASAEVERLTLVAPCTGQLLADGAPAPGSEVAAGAQVASVAGDGPPVVEGFIPVSRREQVQPGLDAACAGAEGEACRGRVREVAPVADAAGTVRVVVEIDDTTGLPPPGEGVELEIRLAERASTLSVPEAALSLAAGGASVFVLDRRGQGYVARSARVSTGERADGRVEITAGLNAGERVVVAGAALLSDGTLAVETAPAPEGAE